ncbi:MAG: choice-of-anchor D domain-containing protein [Myxococcaceae bacterium]
MKSPKLSILLVAGLFALAGCRSCDRVTSVKPVIGVSPVALDFGKVKVEGSAVLTVNVAAQSQASVLINQVTLEGPDAARFTLVDPPTMVDALATMPLQVRFSPTAVQAYEAVAVIESNDAEHPSLRVPLRGEGTHPVMIVTPECAVAKHCNGTAVVTPPSIDFAPEPFLRLLQVPATELPSISIVDESEVALLVTKLAIEGADAAAFSFAGNSTLPAGGLLLDPSTGESGVNLNIRFKPTSEAQPSYQAEVVINSDDPAHAEVRVKLTGTLRNNLPPVVCANIVRVLPGDGSAPLSWAAKTDWAPLLIAPPAGYDFTQTRDIQPKSDVTVSAISDSAEPTACTSDPEDGRIGVTFLWELISVPPGATTPALGGAATSQATLRPFATGEYTLRLTSKDTQGHASSTTVKFVVAIKEDLVAQLSWSGFAEVDLDVHLIRPSSVLTADPFSGAFSFFEEGLANKTSGDVNGYSRLKKENTPGFDFEWGRVGTSDDPRLNLDDFGSGALVENVSLNYPENDPVCDGGPCTYKVMVHYYADRRAATAPPACMVGSGCVDGAACDCAAGSRCVANGSPDGGAPSGAGKCYVPPAPVVKLFFKANPVPAKVIPLEGLVPPDDLVLPAPCQLLYVADVVWPQAGAPTDGGLLADGGSSAPQVVVKGADATGRITSPVLARFGSRSGLQCSPNANRSGVDWYVPAP